MQLVRQRTESKRKMGVFMAVTQPGHTVCVLEDEPSAFSGAARSLAVERLQVADVSEAACHNIRMSHVYSQHTVYIRTQTRRV